MAKRIQLNEAQLKRIIKEAVQAAMQQSQQQQVQQPDITTLGETQLLQMLQNAQAQNNQQLFQSIADELNSNRAFVPRTDGGDLEQYFAISGGGTRMGYPYLANFNTQQLMSLYKLVLGWYTAAINYGDTLENFIYFSQRCLSDVYRNLANKNGLSPQGQKTLKKIGWKGLRDDPRQWPL